MPQIASYDDVKANRIKRDLPEGLGWRTNFLTHPEGADVTEEPMGFLVEGNHERVIRPHFHENDQFQVVVSGGGVLGKHKLSDPCGAFLARVYAVRPDQFRRGRIELPHAARAQGPGRAIPAGRARQTRGGPQRKPWQVTEAPDFTRNGDVSVRPFSQIKDDRGLAAYSLSLAPNATVTAPDPSQSGGQHIIVTKGSLAYQGREYKAVADRVREAA